MAEGLTIQQQNYRRRKAAGMCARNGCFEAPIEGKTMCQPHLEEMRRAASLRYRNRKRMGVCPTCNKPKRKAHLVRCLPCETKLREARDMLMRERRERGLCVTCGAYLPVSGKEKRMRCEACLAKARERDREQRLKRKRRERMT